MRAESPQTSAAYLRWAYLPVSVAILAVVAATDVTPAVFRGRRGNGGIHCRAPSACESFARKAATRGAWHYVSFHPRPAAEMQYFRSDTRLGEERNWERVEAAAGHVIRAGRTTMTHLYEQSRLGASVPFDELQRRAFIHPLAQA